MIRTYSEHTDLRLEKKRILLFSRCSFSVFFFRVVTSCIRIVKMLLMWKQTRNIYYEWCFLFDLSPGLWFYLCFDPSQSLQLQGVSSWNICFTFSVLLLSGAPFFSAGWSCLDSHLNIALLASEFIIGILLSQVVSERGYLKEMNFHAGISSFLPVFSLANWSFFLPFATIFPRLQWFTASYTEVPWDCWRWLCY